MVFARSGLLLAFILVVPGATTGPVVPPSGVAAVPVAPSLEPVPDACRPGGPLQVALTGTPVAGGMLALDYVLTPVLDAAWIAVEIELGPGARVLSHQEPAPGPLARGAARNGRALVELPDAVRSGRQVAEVRVYAFQGLAQPDGSVERVGSEAVLRVGEGELPIDARPVASGGLTTWDVPARHEGGAR